MRFNSKSLLLPAAVAAFLSLPDSVSAAGYWKIHYLRKLEGISAFSTIAIDKNGNYQVAYENGTNVRHIERVSNVWNEDTIQVECCGYSSKVFGAIDTLGRFHVAYHNFNTTKMFRSVRDKGKWNTVQLDTIKRDDGYHLSITVDPANNVHIFYPFFYQYPGGRHNRLAHVRCPETGSCELKGMILDRQSAKWNSGVTNGADNLTVASYAHDGPELLLGNKPGASAPWTWDTLLKAGTGEHGHYTLLRKTKTGKLMLAHQNAHDNLIRLMTKEDTGWTTETVADPHSWTMFETPFGFNPDGDDSPVIAYYDFLGKNLKVATRSGNNWTSEIVDSAGTVGMYASMAVKPDGHPVIVYSDSTGSWLKLAERVGSEPAVTDTNSNSIPDYKEIKVFFASDTAKGTDTTVTPVDSSARKIFHKKSDKFHWYQYVVDDVAATGMYSTLAFGSNGQVNVGYRNVGKGIKWARLNNHAWTIEFADSLGGSYGARMAMAMYRNIPHIVYQDALGGTMFHAVRSGGNNWTRTKVLETLAPNHYGELSAVSDTKGVLHVSMIAADNGGGKTLGYASRDTAGAWTQQLINGFTPYQWTSIALTKAGVPRIAVATQGSELGASLLTKNGASWSREEIPFDKSHKARGNYLRTRTGKDGNPRIAAFNQDDNCVYFYHNDGKAWNVDKVDSAGLTMKYEGTLVGLALDSVNNPYVAYPTGASGDLMLAWKQDSTWFIQKVDSTDDVGSFVSLAIGPDGMPAMSYFNATKNRLQVSVGSLTAPPDDNKNGIPDYKETASVARRLVLPGLRPLDAGEAYLLDGRKLPAGKKAKAANIHLVKPPAPEKKK